MNHHQAVDGNPYNYDGECDGYDHAYQIGLIAYVYNDGIECTVQTIFNETDFILALVVFVVFFFVFATTPSVHLHWVNLTDAEESQQKKSLEVAENLLDCILN